MDKNLPFGIISCAWGHPLPVPASAGDGLRCKPCGFGMCLDSSPETFHNPSFRDLSPTVMLELILLTPRKLCH